MDLTAACGIKPAVPSRIKAVEINGIAISRGAIAQEAQNHPAEKPGDAWTFAARALAIRELLLQEARRLGLVAAPLTDGDGRTETGEEALVRAVVDREVATPEPDEASCHRYYTHNQRRFRSADMCEVSHILFAAAPKDTPARQAARHDAEHVLALLSSEPEQFPKLARAHSACPSREVGGNLGQIGPGQTVPEFERALAGIAEGTVHPSPIESRYGFHIVRVNRREPGRQMPFEMVHRQIGEYLGEHVRRTAIRQYITVLAGRARISGVDLAASESPLVQ